MKLETVTEKETGVLIIGGGGVGLRAAIEAAKSGVPVTVIAKARIGYASNTSISGGAFAAAARLREPDDSPEVHLRDTVVGGRFINNQRLAAVVTSHSPQQVQDLQDFGVSLARRKDGSIDSVPTPGHSYRRTVRTTHSAGPEFTLPMREYALRAGVQFREGITVSCLLEHDGAVVGAVGIDREGKIRIFPARAVILATGGAGHLYRNNNNAGGITGDGYALAYEMGLTLGDMEFVQFYPTALGRLGRSNVLYETMVLYAGARLRNALGEDILEKYGLRERAEITRDNVARTIFREVAEGRGRDGGVIMDLTTGDRELGLKVLRAHPFPLPEDYEHLIVSPTVHFFMGGVKIDEQGKTEREGLWAAGEVTFGVHGANRLGSNSLAEVFAFGAIAGREAAARAKAFNAAPEPDNRKKAEDALRALAATTGLENEREVRDELQKLMWNYAGIVREAGGLKKALESLPVIAHTLVHAPSRNPQELARKIETRHLLTVAEIICQAALLRAESRGAHYRQDFPAEDNRNWLRNILVTKQDDSMVLTPVAVDFPLVPPPEAGPAPA
ncbi:MAG: FAD-dependent oxidoreductase [Chloroflexota bacterium]